MRANGTVQWLRWEVTPWKKADGTTGGIVIFTEDITRRRQDEDALRDGDAQKREFYRRTIFAATDGKLLVSDRHEIDAACGPALASRDIKRDVRGRRKPWGRRAID